MRQSPIEVPIFDSPRGDPEALLALASQSTNFDSDRFLAIEGRALGVNFWLAIARDSHA